MLSKFSKNTYLVAMVFYVNPALGAERATDFLEHFADVCDARLLPEQKIALWIYTGSTTSTEETKCMTQLALREMRRRQNEIYLEQRSSDASFRELALSLSSDERASYADLGNIGKQMSAATNNQAQSNLPIETLTAPGYQSLK